MHWPAVFAAPAAPAVCGDSARGRLFARVGRGGGIASASPSPRYIPPAVDPAQGTVLTANADPVGAALAQRAPARTLRWMFP